MQILIFLTALALMSALFFAKKETLSKKAKIAIVLVLSHAIMFAWLYEFNTSKVSENNRVVLNAFKQGKTIYCADVEVNATQFIFVSGTLSFIPNDKNKSQQGLVLDIVTCKIQN